jgi:uncharacterized repeat protein (TIGR02543 family)
MKRNLIIPSVLITLVLISGFTGCTEFVFTCTLEYHANGGTGTVPDSQTTDTGAAVTVAGPDGLSYPGKSFTGWATGNGKSFAPGDQIKMDFDYTLYAQWSTDLYTVKYNANGGSGEVPVSGTALYNTDLNVSDQESLAYTGKAFGGWNTEADGSGASYAANDTIKVTGSTVLYAQWLFMQYTVTYNISDGSGTVPEPKTVDGGDSVRLVNRNGFSRDGYLFGGWNTNLSGTGTVYDAGSSFIPTGNSADITLYAIWIAPQIRTENAYKEVTNDGTVRIHLVTGPRYIFKGTEEYRLYRSETESGIYSVVATVSPDQLVLEDTTVNWMTAGNPSAYYYKVAAVSDGIEAVSTNGVRIDRADPKVCMCYTRYSYGYCGVRLEKGGEYEEWAVTTNSSTKIHELLSPAASPPPPDIYTLYTSSLALPGWSNLGPLAIRAGHEYTICVKDNTVESSFAKSNWTFF